MKLSNGKKNILIAAIVFMLAEFAFCDSVYVVKEGDTLWSISRKYQLTVPELRAANNLGENDVLKTGAKLKIPSADISTAAVLNSKKEEPEKNNSSNETPKSVPVKTEQKPTVTSENKKGNPGTYVVVAKDTWYGLSRKFDVPIADLFAANNADSSTVLKVGQKINIPGTKQNTAQVQKPAVQAPQETKKTESENKKVLEKTGNTASQGAKADGSVVWPLKSPMVKNINGKVSGVLLTGTDNEPVKCVREGTVMYTGVYRGFGELVFVQSKTGLIYSYSGLDSVSVKKGEYVVAGTELGKTGKGSESDIKFMVFQNGKPIDPAKAPRG